MSSRQRVWLLRLAGLGLGLVLVVVAELLLHLVPLILCTLAANEAGFAPGAGAAPPLEEHLARQWQQEVAKAAEQPALGNRVKRGAL